jgi:tetratricopeptide (TPR) repeat protein
LLNNSPWLKIAVNLNFLDREIYLKFISRLEEEINRRNHFQKLIFQGKEQAKQKFFDRALATFLEAKQLFITEELKTEITSCQYQLEKQEKYEQILKKANNLARKGEFQGAIDLLKPALIEFSRTDGKSLLDKLEQVARGKEYFLSGLKLEKEGRLDKAKNNYQQAVKLIPKLTECRIRLAIIALKNNNCSEAFSHIDNIAGEQAAYIRGFAYAKQGKWQQADREWQSISHNDVKAQRQSLKILAQRDRLTTMSKIEQLVDSGNLEQARSISLEFIQKFGVHRLVEDNLQGHIQAILETKIWKTQDWNNIATTTEKFWIESQDITSLHNWAVATYYQAQINPNRLADLVIAWSTALANIQIDPSLKDLPWLENIILDLEQVSTNLTELLEKVIDAVKDRDVEQYLQLRDLYRCETLALRLIKHSPSTGVRVKQLLLSPGCYQRHLNTLPKFNLPAEPWGELYTNWGEAVAACIEGDLARAIQIKPKTNPSSVAEQSADSFIAYHEGCYYLQQHNWRKAITILKQVQEKIRTSSDCCEEIDKLCEKQRQNLSNFHEHLEFAQFWYDLLASYSASSYLAEYKARQIEDKLANEKINAQNALSQLEAIKKIDPHNPVVIDLIERVEFVQEAEAIDRLLKNDRFEEAVRRAKSSKNYKIRFLVAEICLDILIKGLESHSFSFELIHQLGRWAYELCPDEPAFQEIYRSLKIYY